MKKGSAGMAGDRACERLQPRERSALRISCGAGLFLPVCLSLSLVREGFAAGEVGPVPDGLRERLELSPFYQKHIEVEGFPILGSAGLSDAALREAAWILARMMEGRGDLLRAMADQKVRLVVMAWNEFTTDVPEHSQLKPKVYWDRRARGLGATLEIPVVSCAEENILGYPGDPYSTENILIHEFAHAVHDTGLNRVDPTFDGRLKAAFEAAKAKDLWKGTYAANNRHEYWAEVVQNWFDDNRENDSLHNHVNTRKELRDHDPAAAALCEEVFGDRPWRYVKPARREAADRAHLEGYDPGTAPRFRWREEPIGPKPRVSIETALGDIEVELDATAAPKTTRNFLKYCLEGFYADGDFFRVVREDNQPGNAVRIGVIQAKGNQVKEAEFPEPIALERTSVTGLRHRDGTISMARDGPDSARDHFFICIGDQPELDFGGKRNQDGQGFAAFGRVVRGMDLVRKIQASAADGQILKHPVKIQRAIRTR